MVRLDFPTQLYLGAYPDKRYKQHSPLLRFDKLRSDAFRPASKVSKVCVSNLEQHFGETKQRTVTLLVNKDPLMVQVVS